MRLVLNFALFLAFASTAIAGEKAAEETTYKRATDTIVDDLAGAGAGEGDVDDKTLWSNTYFNPKAMHDEVQMLAYRPLDCEMPEAVAAFGAKVHKFDVNSYFYLVPCRTGDLNIEHYVAQISPRHEGNAELHEFEYPIGFNRDNFTLIVNPEYWADSDWLMSTSYHSSGADCGVYQVHRYRPKRDYFELIEYREKANCDSVQTPPAEYPLVWTIEEMGQ
ncbi:hypothetical protein N9K16_05340 [Alphaproteobacteria bacterium]|nr:hypothetical protein [Alphaproteobacteria bacterium]